MKISKQEALSILDEIISEAENVFIANGVSKSSLENWNYQLSQAAGRVFEMDSREIALLKEHDNKISILSAIMNSNSSSDQVYAQRGAEQMHKQVVALQQIRSNIEADKICEISPSVKIDHISQIILICSKFHLVQRQLKSRYSDRDTLIINDEYDTQDLFHSLLHLYFDDIRPEEWTPSYAGSSSRVDFLLKDPKIIIEIKKTRQSLKAKNVGEQLLIDIARYKSHPDCDYLFCFVYDPEGWIDNPRGLEEDLASNDNGFNVKVMIVPS